MNRKWTGTIDASSSISAGIAASDASYAVRVAALTPQIDSRLMRTQYVDLPEPGVALAQLAVLAALAALGQRHALRRRRG